MIFEVLCGRWSCREVSGSIEMLGLAPASVLGNNSEGWLLGRAHYGAECRCAHLAGFVLAQSLPRYDRLRALPALLELV